MKDFFEKELNVNDKVVFMEINYRKLMVGTIIKINDKKITIKTDSGKIIYQFGNKVIKF